MNSALLKKLDFDARKKKDDDCDPKLQYLTGNVELQINLLTQEEASSEPVGRKRRKPNHSPYLPPPDRAHMDHFWLTSRVKRLSEVLWRKCGKKSIIISCLMLFAGEADLGVFCARCVTFTIFRLMLLWVHYRLCSPIFLLLVHCFLFL
uniref:Ferlin C-terminal domain-containing protein n=1 Tax=Parascaris univalens TaxID=6257 RepID=A0A914ZY15_PARUN